MIKPFFLSLKPLFFNTKVKKKAIGFHLLSIFNIQGKKINLLKVTYKNLFPNSINEIRRTSKQNLKIHGFITATSSKDQQNIKPFSRVILKPQPNRHYRKNFNTNQKNPQNASKIQRKKKELTLLWDQPDSSTS